MEAITTSSLLYITFAHIWQFVYLKAPSPLIYGGDKVNITDAPFMAFLKNVDRRSTCGAAIIHTKMLLSAAHCNRRKGRKVIIAGTDTPETKPPRGQYFDVKEIVSHPGYNIGDKSNDLCVVIINKKFKFNAQVKPILMADANLMPEEGEMTIIYGFGVTETLEVSEYLRKLALPFMNRTKCIRMWRNQALPENTICAGGESGKGGCDGDSGSPLVYKNRLLGIIANGPTAPCGKASFPMVSTHIPPMRKFINNVMKNNIETQCAFKVQGGSPVHITDAPFVASFKLEDRRFTCAATIVHEQFLIATAHCLQSFVLMNGHLTITVGSETNNDGWEYTVEKIFIHPEFDMDTYDFDLAVIKLEKEMTTSDRVMKVELAEWMEPTPGVPVTVYGFAENTESGYASLHKLSLPYYDWRSCKNLFARNAEYVITYQMFCAGEEGKDDTCAGDNGGPVIYNDVLYGITSWGEESCWRRYPSVFTLIPPLKPYIEDIIKNN